MKTLIDISPERTGNGFRFREIYPKIKDAVVIKGMHIVQYKYRVTKNTYPEFATPYEKLKLLKNKYPDAYVFYVDRDKDEWIPSLYNHWIKHGGTLKFTDWHNNVMDRRVYETDKLIDHAKKVFGDNFYLLNFKCFVDDPNTEFNRLLSHFGLDAIVIVNEKHNASWNSRQVELCRFFNRIVANYGKAREWVELINK